MVYSSPQGRLAQRESTAFTRRLSLMGPGHTLAEIFTAWSGPSIGALATLIVSFSVVGALIASHRPENPIGWIFLAVGFFQGLLSAGDQYAVYALLTDPGSPIGSGGGLARAVDLGARARPDPGVPAPAVPRRSPAFASLAPGGLARRPLHRTYCRVVDDRALAREGSSAIDRR